MKRFAVLVLLTALTTASVFAIDGIGDFEAGVELSVPNVGGADDGKPLIGIDPYITFSKDFENGFVLEATLDNYLEITTEDLDDKIADDLSLEILPSYGLEAGPGTLTLALSLNPVFHLVYYGLDTNGPDILFNPSINYSFNPGFGTLGFELGTSSEYADGELIRGGLGMIDKENEDGDGYGLVLDDLYFKASLELEMGLSFWLSPRLYVATKDGGRDTELAFFRCDVSYALPEPEISFGLEAAIPTMEDGMKYVGLELEPHVEAKFGAIGVWFKFNVAGIGSKTFADMEEKDATPVLTPYIGVSYSF